MGVYIDGERVLGSSSRGSDGGGGGVTSGPVVNDLSTGEAEPGSGLGSASIAGGEAVLAFNADRFGQYRPGEFQGPRVTVPNVVPLGTNVRIYSRFTLVGDNTTWAKLGLVDEATNQFVYFQVRASDGQMVGYSTNGAVYNTLDTIARGGTGWIGVERIGATIGWWWAENADTSQIPTSGWKHLGGLAWPDIAPNTAVMALAKSDNGLVGSCSMSLYVERL